MFALVLQCIFGELSKFANNICKESRQKRPYNRGHLSLNQTHPKIFISLQRKRRRQNCRTISERETFFSFFTPLKTTTKWGHSISPHMKELSRTVIPHFHTFETQLVALPVVPLEASERVNESMKKLFPQFPRGTV